MRKVTHLMIILFIPLSVCGSPAQLLTQTPPVKFNLTPTRQPDATPTPTEDPLAGAPEGATRASADGKTFYMDIMYPETGKIKETFTWTDITGPKGEVIWSQWEVSHIVDSPANLNGGIPMLETDDSPALSNDSDPLFINFPVGVIGPYLKHENHPFINRQSLTTAYVGLIEKGSGLPESEVVPDIINHKPIRINFKIASGETLSWISQKGVVFHYVKWEDLTQENFPGLSIIESTNIPTKDVTYHWTAFTNSSGQLHILGSMENTENKSPEDWLWLILGPLGPISKGDLTMSSVNFGSSQQLIKQGLLDPYPHFIITSNP